MPAPKEGKPAGFRPFTETHPFLLEKWDYELNKELDPANFSFGSNRKVWWTDSECGHSWARMIKHQASNQRCKTCAMKELSQRARKTKNESYGNFLTCEPLLASEWHSTKNEKPADAYNVRSYVRGWWLCKTCGHEWTAHIRERVRGKGKCPKCNLKILVPGVNDLAIVAPHLLQDFAHDLNELPPEAIRANSVTPVWWRCHKCSRVWTTQAQTRSSKKKPTNCPECYKHDKTSKGQRELFAFIEELGFEPIMNASGLPGTQMDVDVYVAEKHVGFEYQGNYWHSDYVTEKRFSMTSEERSLLKLRKCEEVGIALYFVWDDDWHEQQPAVKAAVRELLLTGTASPLLTKLDAGKRVQPKPRRGGAKYLRSRKLTEEEKAELRLFYEEGGSPALFAQERGLSKMYCYNLVKEEGLVKGARLE